jgi:hypothetical protein
MFEQTKQVPYKVRVDEPDPFFAKMQQQAIGGVEGSAPAEGRQELHSTPIPAEGGFLGKAKDAVTP